MGSIFAQAASCSLLSLIRCFVMSFATACANTVLEQLSLQIMHAGLQESFVRQALLGGKRKDQQAITLTFLPKEGAILSVVAWKAVGKDVKVGMDTVHGTLGRASYAMYEESSMPMAASLWHFVMTFVEGLKTSSTMRWRFKLLAGSLTRPRWSSVESCWGRLFRWLLTKRLLPIKAGLRPFSSAPARFVVLPKFLDGITWRGGVGVSKMSVKILLCRQPS